MQSEEASFNSEIKGLKADWEICFFWAMMEIEKPN